MHHQILRFSRLNILSRKIDLVKLALRSFADDASHAVSNVQKSLNESKNDLLKLDPIELATGMYKEDILDRLGDDDDPYSVKMISRVDGTKEQPSLIPSAFESRMVGCVCEEDSDSIVWMWLHKGEPKRCQCGHWFQLYYQPTFEVKADLSI